MGCSQSLLGTPAVYSDVMGTYLELLPLKNLQPCHGNLECLPLVILQQVLHSTTDKIEALGPARLQRPDTQSASFNQRFEGTALHVCAVNCHPFLCYVANSRWPFSLNTQVQLQWAVSALYSHLVADLTLIITDPPPPHRPPPPGVLRGCSMTLAGAHSTLLCNVRPRQKFQPFILPAMCWVY